MALSESGIMPPNPLVYHHFPMKCVFWQVFHMLRQIKKHTLDICIVYTFTCSLFTYVSISVSYVCMCADACMHACMDGWMYGCIYVCMDGWMYVFICVCVWKLLVTCSSKHASIFSTTCKVCQGIEWSWHQQRPSLFPVIWKRDAVFTYLPGWLWSLVIPRVCFRSIEVSWLSVCCNGVGLSQQHPVLVAVDNMNGQI